MTFINYASREINCKIVYYGPGLCGKTTNLQYIYDKTQPETRRQDDLARDRDRAHAVLRLPAARPREIRGFKTRFHLYTVPGQVFYDASRKLILKGVDGVVFVADSQIERMEANIESLENLTTTWPSRATTSRRSRTSSSTTSATCRTPRRSRSCGRAQPGLGSRRPGRAAPHPRRYHAGENLVEQLPTGEWVERAPYFEAVAVTGDGVFETLKAVWKLVLKSLA